MNILSDGSIQSDPLVSPFYPVLNVNRLMNHCSAFSIDLLLKRLKYSVIFFFFFFCSEPLWQLVYFHFDLEVEICTLSWNSHSSPSDFGCIQDY